MSAIRTEPGGVGVVETKVIEPTFWNALPHFLPIAIFPLIIVASLSGGWWILAPFIFFWLAGPLDLAFGMDGRNMNPAKTPERRLFWHNLPVWLWAFLWPATLVFTVWQILVSGHLSVWEAALMVFVLAMEAQAVFIVGHELIHRRWQWERRLGEFLLASASYPQYATEHVYIHHAFVGTPLDVGSAPRGESLWHYFPREVASNLLGSWRVAHERLARKGLPTWHSSNPFWRYGLALAFWYAVVFLMGGPWAIPVYMALCLGVVFSMKISNYIQHYGLRRVRVAGGRFEKILPRHSWSVDYRFSNWMFFNMQRHADHHAVWGRRYPLLQFRGADESPQLPGSYGKMFGLAVRPRRWFETMDPLVDEWRARFYPHIDDWSAYDSPVSAARPESFDTIVEIYGAAPRLAGWIERQPDLLDEVRCKEFTDLDLPKGFGPDAGAETIARQGLTRLYWTHEFGVPEMKERIAEKPVQDADDLVEAVRNWSNDKAFQIGIHTLRGNLTPVEAGTALSNLAEASIDAVLSAVTEDLADRFGALAGGEVAAVILGDLASGEAAPQAEIDILFVHDGGSTDHCEALCRRFRDALRDLSRGSLLFAPVPRGREERTVQSLADFAEHHRTGVSTGDLLELTRARCIFTSGDSGLGARFDETRREILARAAARDAFIGELRAPPGSTAEPGLASLDDMRGGLGDVERAARFLQFIRAGDASHDPAPAAASVFQAAGEDGSLPADAVERLKEAARMWRNLRGIQRLVADDGVVAETAAAKVKVAVARSCGLDDVEALTAVIRETASRAAEDIGAIVAAGLEAEVSGHPR